MDPKVLYRTYVAALTVADPDQRLRMLTDLLTPDFVAHDLEATAPPGDLAALSNFRAAVLAAFPDQTAEIVDLVAEGDRVSSRQRLVGTHRGPFWGVAATGRRIDIDLVEWVRVQDGRIAERWVLFDRAAVREALEGPERA